MRGLPTPSFHCLSMPSLLELRLQGLEVEGVTLSRSKVRLGVRPDDSRLSEGECLLLDLALLAMLRFEAVRVGEDDGATPSAVEGLLWGGAGTPAVA